MTDKKKGRPNEGSPKDNFDCDHRPPAVTGQCAEVFELVQRHGSMLSLVLTADYAIPEAAARIHDLRAQGFNIVTTILPKVEFRGRIRRNVARYSLGIPHWPAPGFLIAGTKRQAGYILPDASLLAGLLVLAVAVLLLIGGAP